MRVVLNHSSRIPVIGLICCVLLTGCGGRAPEAGPGVSIAKTVSASRVVIPVAGGQTIQVPSVMPADAYELWHPLSPEEQKRPARPPALPAGTLAVALGIRLPPAESEEMQQYLYRLTHSGKSLAGRVLARAEIHLPVILEALEARGLPRELACLPMVESAFEPGAVSPAGAAGLWQLMPETARRFGLTVTSEIDERFDVRKSTGAATAYLAALYKLFGDWPLALAAYNCGEGAMRRALSATNTETLPDLARACRVAGDSGSPLAGETLRFVPRFAAAVHVMANSNVLGLASRAVLELEPQAAPSHGGEPPLLLVGRYETILEPEIAPARSVRLE